MANDPLQMAMHCHGVFRNNAAMWRVRVGISAIPIVKPKSMLHWVPVLNRVNIFPIMENEVCEEDVLQRPLFYCELDARRVKEMKRRYHLTKIKRKRSPMLGL